MSNPLCFIRLGEPLASNPRLLRFCTQYANDFANTANPVSIPVFLFLNEQWRGGGGGGRVNCGRVHAMFNQELTPPEPCPNLILFDLLHCYKKFIHAAGDHHWSRQNTRLVRTVNKGILLQCAIDLSSTCIYKTSQLIVPRRLCA
jgi:hypothetical protein